MARGKLVKRETVEAVKETNAKYPDLPNTAIAKLCDATESTVSRVFRGEYDHLLEPQESEQEGPSESDELHAAILEELEIQTDMMHVIGVMMANCWVVRDEDNASWIKRLHNLNPRLNFKELDKYKDPETE